MTLYALTSVLLLGAEFHAGDELPTPAVTRSDDGFDRDTRGCAFITDRQGRHWRVSGASSNGPMTAALYERYDPEDPLVDDLVGRGLATTDAKLAARLREIRELEAQRNAENAGDVDKQVAALRAKTAS